MLRMFVYCPDEIELLHKLCLLTYLTYLLKVLFTSSDAYETSIVTDKKLSLIKSSTELYDREISKLIA